MAKETPLLKKQTKNGHKTDAKTDIERLFSNIRRIAGKPEWGKKTRLMTNQHTNYNNSPHRNESRAL